MTIQEVKKQEKKKIYKPMKLLWFVNGKGHNIYNE